MALVTKTTRKTSQSSASSEGNSKSLTGINYDQIKWINQLCADPSLSPSERHELVMKQYGKVLQQTGPTGVKGTSTPPSISNAVTFEGLNQPHGEPIVTVEEAPSTSMVSNAPSKEAHSLYPRQYRVHRDCHHFDETRSKEVTQKEHDIGYHMRRLHHEKVDDDGPRTVKEAMRLLVQKAKKMPFERSAEENAVIYKALQKFDFLVEELSSTLLRELSVFAFVEEWHEGEVTVFGNTGLHLVLSGGIVPQSAPFVRRVGQSDEQFLSDWCVTNGLTSVGMTVHRSSEDSSEREDEQSRRSDPPTLRVCEPLRPGDFFGTLKKVNVEHPLAVRINEHFTNRMLTGLTVEQKERGKQSGCILLKLNTSDYERIVTQIADKDAEEKVRLLSLKAEYKLFPKQVLAKVATLVEWLRFPDQAVLVQEGVRAPYIAFLKEGACNVFRQTVARKALPLGKAINKKVQVLIGRIEAGTCVSVGDASFFENEPMNCTIISDTPVVLGVIELEKLHSLDDTTRLLLKQSCTRVFSEVTDEQVQKMYVEQAVKDEWAMAKHSIVMDVINTRGIRPGYGKWS